MTRFMPRVARRFFLKCANDLVSPVRFARAALAIGLGVTAFHGASAEDVKGSPEHIKAAGKHHEWLYALKLQTEAHPTDKQLRAQIIEAINEIYEKDPRLKTILTASELEQNRTPLPIAISRACPSRPKPVTSVTA